MIPSDFVEKISNELGIKDNKLVEKDLYLQGLLLQLSKNNYFTKNFVFKGGTCLTKAYFGYYRFSEDLDFTWINGKLFEQKPAAISRKLLSKEINKIMNLFEEISKELQLDFKKEKSNPHYIQLGGSNRFATFKFWYTPINEERETFIKIQINFVEKIIHQPKKKKLKSIYSKDSEELEMEYPKFAAMAIQSPTFYVYDLKEIAAEKIRALLTRRGFKARDIIDLYMISKKGINIKNVKEMAIEKTIFMLKYLKYKENLNNKSLPEKFTLGEEQKLLLQTPGADFEIFTKNALKELKELTEEVKQKNKKLL